jgi:hypothetical protein
MVKEKAPDKNRLSRKEAEMNLKEKRRAKKAKREKKDY